MRHLGRTLAVATFSILALVACSSSKTSSSGATTTTAKGGATTSAGGSNTTAGGTQTTAAGSNTTAGGTGANGICGYASDIANAAALATPGTDAKSQATNFKNMLTYMTTNAPSSIKGDVATLATAYGKFIDILAKYNYDYTQLATAAATDTSVQDSLKALSTAEVTKATTNISNYFATNCGGTAGS